LIAETDFAITDTASTSRRRHCSSFFTVGANATLGICLVELIAKDHLTFGRSSAAGANLRRVLHFGALGFQSLGELTEATAYRIGLFDPENSRRYTEYAGK
jgi:hypothetical protein